MDRLVNSTQTLDSRLSLPGRGWLRVGILSQVPRVLLELGHNPEQVLAEIGMDQAMLANPDASIPFCVMSRLIMHCVERTGCTHFGLRVGQAGKIETLGPVGRLMRKTHNVETALRSLIQFLHQHDQGAVPSLTQRGQTAFLGYHILEPGVLAADQINAGTMAVALGIMQELCGSEWRPDAVRLPFRRPGDWAVYEGFFQAPVHFDAPQAALEFSVPVLKLPLSGTDPAEYRQTWAILKRQERLETVEQVRRILRAMLTNGLINQESVAKALHMSRRTLVRHLTLEGVSFHDLLAQMRLEVACQLLRDTDLFLEAIATSLGYTNGGPFRRAFKCWTGQTPTQWRRLNGVCAVATSDQTAGSSTNGQD